MKIFFNQLFDYNFYCNKKLIETCSAIDNTPEKSIELFSHVLNVHHRWNAVLSGKAPEYEANQIHSIREWGDIHYENQRSSFEITTTTDDFEKRIDYENDEGRLFTNTVQDMLFHIINHSTHHRGQIAIDFRKNGLEPLQLDYVFYKR
ncbi:MAG: DinB family protein [Maribacter sp.]|uniref:DinB family protein n=1 Tax=Maribacter sp. TaxID=1897614 RepID=UPI0032994CFD